MCTPYSDACRQKCDQMVQHAHNDAHKQHTYTYTQALARRQTQNGFVLIRAYLCATRKQASCAVSLSKCCRKQYITKLVSPVYQKWGEKLRSITLRSGLGRFSAKCTPQVGTPFYSRLHNGEIPPIVALCTSSSYSSKQCQLSPQLNSASFCSKAILIRIP